MSDPMPIRELIVRAKWETDPQASYDWERLRAILFGLITVAERVESLEAVIQNAHELASMSNAPGMATIRSALDTTMKEDK
jgi:hypothetical protein